MITLKELQVRSLGPAKIPSPIELSTVHGDDVVNYVDEEERVLLEPNLKTFQQCLETGEQPLSFELAGPRQRIYFDPSKLKVAIVTCGGLCPGINNVIRGLVLTLFYHYGVRNILGIRYGLQGFVPKYRHPTLELGPDVVRDIHEQGGTILGSSRGHQDVEDIVDSLERMNVQVLFAIGGDGTLRAAHAVAQEIRKRNIKIGIVGVPKTIDNDIPYIERTFGFQTAVSIATESIRSAHVEAEGAHNGVGLVKVMGRHSGYIAGNAALALRDVNLVLTPEVPFDLEGPRGLYAVIEQRLEARSHMVILVAEGAGQKHLHVAEPKHDASGNIKLGDIGRFLAGQIPAHFHQRGIPITLKYIDPSYIIRAARANPSDGIFCGQLADNAVHAAMAGKTEVVVGLCNGRFTHVPLGVVVTGRKLLSLESTLWRSVLEATGQPVRLTNQESPNRGK